MARCPENIATVIGANASTDKAKKVVMVIVMIIMTTTDIIKEDKNINKASHRTTVIHGTTCG